MDANLITSHLDASTGLTCLSCRVVFANGEIQREHYGTDWHRYNLKRKVADLPPITSEQFSSKLAQFQSKSVEENLVDIDQLFCDVCNKRFQSANAVTNHLNSKVHRQRQIDGHNKEQKTLKKKVFTVKQEKNYSDGFDLQSVAGRSPSYDSDDEGWVTDRGTDDESEEYDYDESKAIAVNVCLFCCFISKDMELNLAHMSRFHGFFIPDLEYCVDVIGFLYYLGMKVGSGNMCLYCNKKGSFRSLDACQKHMKDRGHCLVAHEGNDMLEYEDFYDFSSMYPPGDDIESESNVLIQDGWSLILPSGARIGHRSLMRYYRQRLKPISSVERCGVRDKQVNNKIINMYKSIGWAGTTRSIAVQRAKDIKFVHRLLAKNRTQLGVHNNKLFKSKGRCDQ